MMIWLLRTGCTFSNTDRGVLGRGNSIMEFRDSSKEFFVKGLISSQGTPQATIRVGSFLNFGHGWLNSSKANQELEVRRKRHKTEGSSIHSFSQIFGTIKFPTRLVCAAAIFVAAHFVTAGEVAARRPQAPIQDQIEAVGDEYEGYMLQMLYNQMLESNQIVKQGDDNPFAPSNGEMIFRSMQQQVMMQQMAKRRPLGFGSLVARQLREQTGIAPSNLLNSDRKLGPGQNKSGQTKGSSENGHY